MSDFSVLDADMQRDLNRDGLRKLWQALMDGRIESAAKVYARDAILLLPQDGGRIEGRAQIAAGGLMQPGERFVKLGRIVGDGGVWISECDVCAGQQRKLLISIAEMHDGVILRETRYRVPVAAGWHGNSVRAGLG
jgi:hypothetical protein